MDTRQKVLVTGGDSFISRSIINDLSEKHHVVAKNRTELDCFDFSLLNKASSGYDAVINCAAQGGRRFSRDDQNVLMANVKITSNLIKCKAKGSFGKLFLFGSGAEYFQTQDRLFYSLSKKIQTEGCRYISGIVNLRIFGFFSRLSSDRGFIDDVICKSKGGKEIEIWEDKKFDYIFSKDLSKIILDELESKDLKYKEIECVYQKKVFLSDIAKYIVAKLNSKSTINIGSKSKIGYTTEKNWNNSVPVGDVFEGINFKLNYGS